MSEPFSLSHLDQAILGKMIWEQVSEKMAAINAA